jgi:hypothetical protein
VTLSPATSRSGGGGGLYDAYALLQHQLASGTAGGGSTSGSWGTRVLNTEVEDDEGIVSLAANRFTLQAGTYYIAARQTIAESGAGRSRIQDVTNAVTVGQGPSVWGSGGVAPAEGVIGIAAATEFELQWRVSTTHGGNGLGVEVSSGSVEVYAEVEIWRYT